jgi:tetratricopeptide (TPR) repeat protein
MVLSLMKRSAWLVLGGVIAFLTVAGDTARADRTEVPEQPSMILADRSPHEGTVEIQQPDFDRSLRDPALLEQLNLARRLMRDGNYLGASAVLEVLYEEYPNDARIYSHLHNCYTFLQYFDKAVELSRRMADANPHEIRFVLQLAESFTRRGDRDSALAAYHAAAEQLIDRTPNQYEPLLRSMLSFSYAEQALAVIDRVRGNRQDTLALALERAEALQFLKRYGDAASEYYRLVDDTTRAGTTARKKLGELLDFSDSAPAVENVLLEYVRGGSAPLQAIDLLSSHYLKHDRFDRAFEFALLHDSLSGQNGRSLVSFMRRCQDRRLFSETIELGEYVLQRYDSLRHAEQARFMLADACVRLGRYDEAMAHYDTIAATYAQLPDKSMALYQKGRILLDHLNLPEQALELFDSVQTHYRGGEGFIRAQLSIPYCYLRQGQLESAHNAFQQLLKRRLTPDMTEEVRYHVALIKFLGKQPDSARAELNRLLVEHPDGYFVNDAIGLMMVMDEAEEAEDLLYDYSNALLFEQTRQYDSMAVKLELLASAENPALADDALYRLMRISFDHLDTAAAKGYADRLINDFADSYYAPFGLKARADLLRLDSRTREEAADIYRELLKEHPNYPFASEIRAVLRQLDVDQRIG